jgi:hypothetical protein
LAEIDLNKLSTGDKVIGVSGIALFIFSFFSWLGAKVELKGVVAAEASKSGWGWTLTLIAILIGIAMTAVIVLKLLDVKLPDLGGVTWTQVLLGAAAVAFLFILIKVVVGPNIGDTGGLSVAKTRKIGIFLGLIASGGLVAGSWLNFQAEKSAT